MTCFEASCSNHLQTFEGSVALQLLAPGKMSSPASNCVFLCISASNHVSEQDSYPFWDSPESYNFAADFKHPDHDGTLAPHLIRQTEDLVKRYITLNPPTPNGRRNGRGCTTGTAIRGGQLSRSTSARPNGN